MFIKVKSPLSGSYAFLNSNNNVNENNMQDERRIQIYHVVFKSLRNQNRFITLHFY